MFQNLASLSAIVPCYNEENQVETVYRELVNELERYGDFELIFINDGSRDKTLERIQELARRDSRVKYISFSRNFGLEAAFSAGFKYASKEWTIQFDADLQSPPAEAHKLIEKALEGYDAVFAWRQNRQDSWFRRQGSAGQQWFARKVLNIEIPPGASVFRIVRTSVARKVVELRLGTPYFIATLPLLGARYTSVPTAHQARQAGRSRWKLSKLLGHSFELFFGFSFAPLRLIYWLLALCCLLMVVALGMSFFLPAATAATWLSGLVSLETLACLGSLALLGRYVQRIVADGKRPRMFYVRESNLNILPEDSLYEFENSPSLTAPLGANGLAKRG